MKALALLLTLALGAVSCIPQRTTSRANLGQAAAVSAVRQTYHLIEGSFEGVQAEENADAARAEIDRQMRLRGYEPLEPGDFNNLQPDIVVFYSVIDKPFAFKGLVKGESAAGEISRDVRHRFANGTLMVQMKDDRSQKIFWAGCSEGLNDYPGLHREAVSAAARSIMDKFMLLPSGYDRRTLAPKLMARSRN